MKHACEVALLVVVVSVVVREVDAASVDVWLEELHNLQVRLEREARLQPSFCLGTTSVAAYSAAAPAPVCFLALPRYTPTPLHLPPTPTALTTINTTGPCSEHTIQR